MNISINSMRSVQRGFTLIELIVVIVILGILAATALPKFVDFSSEAATAAVQGVAGGISSGSSLQYAAHKAGKTASPTSLSAAAATLCADTASLGSLLQGGWPTGYTGAAKAATTKTCSADGYVECTITKTAESKTADTVVTCY